MPNSDVLQSLCDGAIQWSLQSNELAVILIPDDVCPTVAFLRAIKQTLVSLEECICVDWYLTPAPNLIGRINRWRTCRAVRRSGFDLTTVFPRYQPNELRVVLTQALPPGRRVDDCIRILEPHA